LRNRVLDDAQGVLLDLDGTLAVGNSNSGGYTLLPGAQEFLGHLRTQGLPVVVFTNGTAATPRTYAENLAAAGLEISLCEMMTPSTVAAEYFLSGGFRTVLVLGGEGVSGPLTDAGLEVHRPGDFNVINPDAIYIGWHPNVSWIDIKVTAEAVMAGSPYFVSSDVSFFYTSKGRTLGISGILGAAVAKATGQLATILGKPSVIAAEAAAQRLQCAMEEMAIVGDDPDLEIEMARKIGAIGIGVTSGLSSRATWAALAPDRCPSLVIDQLDDLITHELFQQKG
jgi:4-nitrophenyl phosphatase